MAQGSTIVYYQKKTLYTLSIPPYTCLQQLQVSIAHAQTFRHIEALASINIQVIRK